MKAIHLHLLRAMVFAIAMVFIFIGVAQGDMAVVLRKAIRICLECIGVGA